MGCAVSNIVGMYALALQKDNHWLIRSSFAIADLSIIVALALAWRDEHAKLLIEIEKNNGPKFHLEIVRSVYSQQNAFLFVECSLVNRSLIESGMRSARLIDHDRATDNEIHANEAFLAVSLYDSSVKQISVQGNESGVVTAEKIGILRVENLLRSAPPLLPRGKREVGWLAFPGIASIADGQTDSNRFAITVSDTLGGTHGPVAVPAPVERAIVF